MGGFYLGGVVGIIVEELALAVVTAGAANLATWAARAASQAPRLGRLARAVDTARGVARAASRAARGAGRAVGQSLPRLQRLAELGYSLRVILRPLQRVEVAQRRAVARALEDIEGATGLPVADQRALTRILTRTNDPGRSGDTLNDVADEGQLETLTTLVRCARSGTTGRLQTRGAVRLDTGRTDCDIPGDLRDVDRDIAVEAAADLIDARTAGKITPDEFRRISNSLIDSDANSEFLVETIIEGETQTLRFLGNTDPDVLASVTRLTSRDDVDVADGLIQDFAQDNGADGARLINGLGSLDSDDAIGRFFRYGGSDDLDIDVAQNTRTRLVEGYSNGHITAAGVDDVSEDVTRLEGDPQVEGMENVLDEFHTKSQWGSARGFLYEIRMANREIVNGDDYGGARRLDEGDTLQLSREPFGDSDGDISAEFGSLYNDEGEYTDEVEEIADELSENHPTGGISEAEVRNYLRDGDPESGGEPEFDGFVIERSDGTAVYYEAKSGGIRFGGDIEKKRVYLEAYRILAQDSGRSIDDVRMVLIHRFPESRGLVTSNALQYLRDRSDGTVIRNQWDEVD